MIMEMQNIRENRQVAQRRRVEFTSLEQEINADRESWLERVNVHLERKSEKAINERICLETCHIITCRVTWCAKRESGV